jgi:signal transduction histidine kinase
MIEGQEKERKRIAEDLHDDLGSVLTTLKLHFENFKVNKTKKKFSEEELIDKTEDLLDEAYTKVRSIAHAKNSGVIANQGLLLAIENMAEKVSSSKKLAIDVIDHGLENRLENSLELAIFRIVQELITNIIKHAEAKQATIHLTNHESTLNIMVEDDGKGFDVNNISKKGMGIHSIDKRIEHLDGTMTIESEINKGTTIILDIPI